MIYPPIDRPERIPEVFAAAWMRRDAEGIAALFSEDADFVNVTGLWWRDQEAIRKAHAYGLERIFPGSSLEVVESRVRYLGDDAAIVHAKMRLIGQAGLADMESPGERQTIFIFVARRSARRWLCVAAQNTDIIRGAETNLRDPSGTLHPVSYQGTEG